ncbi:hypothetical protein C8R44DRAFT_754770 [Mycena epipterygia]|nr:hypothetical protein C8R44DRAFT_754770 [Mycena epipterygia]
MNDDEAVPLLLLVADALLLLLVEADGEDVSHGNAHTIRGPGHDMYSTRTLLFNPGGFELHGYMPPRNALNAVCRVKGIDAGLAAWALRTYCTKSAERARARRYLQLSQTNYPHAIPPRASHAVPPHHGQRIAHAADQPAEIISPLRTQSPTTLRKIEGRGDIEEEDELLRGRYRLRQTDL